mmetsp:Transcript_10049/g.17655  ORF Transcript_10049/g.17655 Transcript_10049/m.17655 type:complete len:117 (-) Transcript_10049:238-588(-)|eukprot:CAMPEP_0184524984 /NCGR_PEP_ID=MMETSP0198_2-20121128/9835_1 /TAXON_ID=1112570 /ORGANISM="Thraustochytrium sp., Strain LLF1b" /LENGTH=116 /DNA_ID=CAMNT_0026916371 /DNA_START=124 /DNA_END=474 /DNA_ORIENTATION=+
MDATKDTARLQHPRINGAMMQSNLGKTVVVVGKVIGSNDGMVDLQTSDNSVIKVHAVDANDMPVAQQVYEYTGAVKDQNTLTESFKSLYSENFDLAAYNSMISVLHDQRYSNMFWG